LQIKSKVEKDFKNCKFQLEVLAYFTDYDTNFPALHKYKRVLDIFLIP